MMKTRKLSRPSMKVSGTLKPDKLCLQKKFDASYQSGLPPRLHEKSANDLAEIIVHVAEDDAQAASHFGNALVAHVELLTAFPGWVAWFESGPSPQTASQPISHLLSSPR